MQESVLSRDRDRDYLGELVVWDVLYGVSVPPRLRQGRHHVKRVSRHLYQSVLFT